MSARAERATTEATAAELIEAVKGFRSLIDVGFPVEQSLAYQQAYQAVRMAVAPIETERERIAMKYAKRTRGEVVYRSPGEIVIDPKQAVACARDINTLMASKHQVAVAPFSRADIPREVDGAAIIIKGTVFEQMGPFLVN